MLETTSTDDACLAGASSIAGATDDHGTLERERRVDQDTDFDKRLLWRLGRSHSPLHVILFAHTAIVVGINVVYYMYNILLYIPHVECYGLEPIRLLSHFSLLTPLSPGTP